MTELIGVLIALDNNKWYKFAGLGIRIIFSALFANKMLQGMGIHLDIHHPTHMMSMIDFLVNGSILIPAGCFAFAYILLTGAQSIAFQLTASLVCKFVITLINKLQLKVHFRDFPGAFDDDGKPSYTFRIVQEIYSDVTGEKATLRFMENVTLTVVSYTICLRLYGVDLGAASTILYAASVYFLFNQVVITILYYRMEDTFYRWLTDPRGEQSK